MAENPTRALEKNSAHIGEGVTFKGSISAPNLVVVDGDVEGDVTAKSIKVGPTGLIKGSIVSTDADVEGRISDNVEVKGFLHVRATGRVEGQVMCGDVQIEKGAVLSAAMTSNPAGFEQAEETKVAPPAPPKIKLAAAE